MGYFSTRFPSRKMQFINKPVQKGANKYICAVSTNMLLKSLQMNYALAIYFYFLT